MLGGSLVFFRYMVPGRRLRRWRAGRIRRWALRRLCRTFCVPKLCDASAEGFSLPAIGCSGFAAQETPITPAAYRDCLRCFARWNITAVRLEQLRVGLRHLP